MATLAEIVLPPHLVHDVEEDSVRRYVAHHGMTLPGDITITTVTNTNGDIEITVADAPHKVNQ